MRRPACADDHRPRRHGWRRLCLGAWLVVPACLLANPAGATFAHIPHPTAFLQQQRTLSYPFEQVWPTAIRYLVVDRGYRVSDRDENAGYILFEFAAGERQGQGSIEMIRVEDAAGRPSVQVSVNTSAGPSHLPHTLLEGIARKVREERGQPAPPPPPKSPPKDEAPPKDGDGPGDGSEDDPDPPPDDGGPPMMPPPLEPNRLR